MTTEEQYARIIEQNDKAAKKYDEECAKNDEHREYVRRESPTLRDDFAKAALQGMAASYADDSQAARYYASLAYALADAMLAERAKETP